MGKDNLAKLTGLYLKKTDFSSFRGHAAKTAQDKGTITAFRAALERAVEEKLDDILEVITVHSNTRMTEAGFAIIDNGILLRVFYGENRDGDKIYEAIIQKAVKSNEHLRELERFKARSEDDSRLVRNLLRHLDIENKISRQGIAPQYARAYQGLQTSA